jgi:menaquinone-dependent protoporphyrinogen oxidase
LVAYSSGYGATKEVAEEIAKILAEQLKCNVTSKSVHECDDINSYDAIVLGSSVRADKPLANARDFFSIHRHRLGQKKLALFIVSITASTSDGIEIAKRDYVTQLHDRYPWIAPISVAAFGGKIDFDKLNTVMQSLVRNVMKEKGVDGNGSFDARNWDDIRGWAKKLAFQFKKLSPVS